MTRPIPHRILRWVDAPWLALLAAYILAGVALVPFHGDESTLIFMGRDFHYLFVEGDLSEVLYDDSWSRRPGEQKLRLENGTISKTIYGWLAWARGYGIDDFNGAWRWSRDYESNLRSNNVPSEQLLQAARMSSAIQLALAVAVFFQFTRIVLNRPTAYVASALFALHPNVLINGRRAMMEGSHLLGLTLVLLAGALLLRDRHWRNYLLLGVCMGIALAAKHPNAIVSALVFAAMVGTALRQARRKEGWALGSIRKRGAEFFLPPIVAAIVFLALNPAWWSAPLQLPRVIVDMRVELLAGQVGWLGGYESLGERIIGFFRYVFAAQHQYFEVAHWAEYDVIRAQIGSYESSGLAGVLFGGSGWAGLIGLLLAVYGAYSIARSTDVMPGNRILLLVWVIGAALTTILLTPLPWARYYLPLAPALLVLAARALVDICSTVLMQFRRGEDGLTVLD